MQPPYGVTHRTGEERLGPGRAAVIDRLYVALAVNQPAVNCQTSSIRGQPIA